MAKAVNNSPARVRPVNNTIDNRKIYVLMPIMAVDPKFGAIFLRYAPNFTDASDLVRFPQNIVIAGAKAHGIMEMTGFLLKIKSNARVAERVAISVMTVIITGILRFWNSKELK